MVQCRGGFPLMKIEESPHGPKLPKAPNFGKLYYQQQWFTADCAHNF
ncbi:hypothetical protein COLO4_26373 [Corchorus olitorius]|uniref:Uncharacterized protein n=1 Tax=Corchorus olitorius TaxID=93759 RepID=A0A1R3HXF9_9ROSI|nr:hypothetical protein COLO4_26373 [Corchorus olitorius]